MELAIEWNAQTPPYLGYISWRVCYVLMNEHGHKLPQFSSSAQLDGDKVPEHVQNVLLLLSQMIHQRLPKPPESPLPFGSRKPSVLITNWTYIVSDPHVEKGEIQVAYAHKWGKTMRQQEGITFHASDFTEIERELLSSLDECASKLAISDFGLRFGGTSGDIQSLHPGRPVVFISYRSGYENIAERLARFLERYHIEPFYAPWEIGWGDSMSKGIEEGIAKSRAGIVVFTLDYLDGAWADAEYRGLITKSVDEREGFKVGVALFEGDKEDLPVLLRDKIYADFQKDSFDIAAMILVRGVFGLGQKARTISRLSP